MQYFDFHHHDRSIAFGIYNLKFPENPHSDFFSAGIHPDAVTAQLDEKLLWLNEAARAANCVAIGECGFDARCDASHELQTEVFEKQLLLANKLQKPLIIHCVKRFSSLIPFHKMAKVPMIVHGFNKRKTIGVDLLQHQFYLSFGKSLLYNVNLQHFLKETPIQRIFLETDSSEEDLAKIYEMAAKLTSISVEELTLKIKKNLRFIKIPI